MPSIRLLAIEDLPLVMRLKQQAGWNQTERDLSRFAALSAGGSFVAELDGQSVGVVMTFEFGSPPAEAVAWIAMMLVDEQQRGKGIGRALMNRALEHLDERGVTSVRLDATPLGQPLYETLGFVPQFGLSRYAGTLPVNRSALSEKEIVSPVDPRTEIEEIAALDRRVTHTDRRELLERLIVENPHELRVVRRDQRVVGYITSRPGANARQIGPCIAEPEAGSLLLADAMTRYPAQSVFVDIPLDNHQACALAASHGLSVQRNLTRMCRGRQVIEQLPLLWASSSPEKG